MKRLPLVVPALGLVLVGAHFLRIGQPGWLLAAVVFGGLLFTGRAWVRLAGIGALLAGGLLWAQVAAALLRFRLAAGLDWHRLAVIMAAVELFTLAGAWILARKKTGPLFPKAVPAAGASAAAFLFTTAALALAEAKVSFPLLLLERYAQGWGGLEAFGLGVYAALVVGAMAVPSRAVQIRPRIWALFSVAFFLQFILGLAGVSRMLMTGSLHLPVPALIVAGPLYRGHGLFMPILYGVTLLLVGSAWCSYLCYIGAWDDMASRRSARRRPKPLPGWAKWSRVAVLAFVVASALGLRLAGVEAGAAAALAAVFGVAGVLVMATVSRRMGMMAHCTAYCPIGLISGIAGRLSPWRVAIAQGCDGCGRCSRACRYDALTSQDLARGRPGLSCTLCGDCVSACPGSRLHYRFPGLSPASSRLAFLVLVVSLHAVFLGVARI